MSTDLLNTNNLFSLKMEPRLKDKEKVSIDKDIPISKMDTISDIYNHLVKYMHYILKFGKNFTNIK